MSKLLIYAVMETLESVPVSGHENWDKMLGCYRTLKSIADGEDNAPENKEEEVKEDV